MLYLDDFGSLRRFDKDEKLLLTIKCTLVTVFHLSTASRSHII